MIDLRQMNHLLKRMGITPKDIEANRVIIEKDDSNIIIDNPVVTLISFQGQNTFQIVGDYREEEKISKPKIEEEDIETVMEQTGKTREEALKALEETNGDLAQAIIKLKDNTDK